MFLIRAMTNPFYLLLVTILNNAAGMLTQLLLRPSIMILGFVWRSVGLKDGPRLAVEVQFMRVPNDQPLEGAVICG